MYERTEAHRQAARERTLKQFANPAARQLASDLRKAYWEEHPEERERKSIQSKAQFADPAARAVLSAVKKAQYAANPELGRQNGLRKLGTTHTPEARAKMSAARKGRAFSQEHKAKIKASLTGRTFSEEHCEKISDHRARHFENGGAPGGRTKVYRINGIPCSGTYERRFVEACLANGVKIERGRRRQYRAVDGSYHYYIPDFYLPEHGVHVECKGEHLLAEAVRKMASAVNRHLDLRLVVITEAWLQIEKWLPLVQEARDGRRFVVCPYNEGEPYIGLIKTTGAVAPPAVDAALDALEATSATIEPSSILTSQDPISSGTKQSKVEPTYMDMR